MSGCLVRAGLCLALFSMKAMADRPDVSFTREPGGLIIRVGGRPFATYRLGNARTTRPYFQDLFTPAGARITRPNPPIEGQDLTDHATYHPGLWMAFGDLSGADSWRNRDPVRHDRFVNEPAGGPGRGAFAVENTYFRGGQPIALERTSYEIHARAGAVLLTWESVFRPVGGEVVFGDQEEMGLAVRMATPLAVIHGGRIIDSERRVNEAEVWGRQADWCSYQGTIDGKRAGVVILTDPRNFRRCWFHARDYGLLAANPFGRQAFTKGEPSRVVVMQGETLTLRFGVLVHDGEPDVQGAMGIFLADQPRP
jgi:hypothetical protein